MPRVDANELAGQLRLSITRLARILRQQDTLGLGATLTSALATVNHHGPLTTGELATREHVAPPSITRVVDKLEQQGLVARRPHPTDGRVVVIEVTAEGRERILESRSRRTAWLAERLRDLPPADLECLAGAAAILARLTEPAA